MKKQKRNKKQEKQLKKSSGITLIALVITIVVLIILATVSITLTLRGGGIFGAAETAKELQEMAAIKEEAELVKADLLTKSYTEEGVEFNKSTLLQALKDHFEGSIIKGNKVIVRDGKYEIIVDDNLNISVEKARETQKGDVALSYTTRETSNGTQINLKVELLGIPEYDLDMQYEYLENEYLPGMTAEELLVLAGELIDPGAGLTAETVYNSTLKSNLDNMEYADFLVNGDKKTQEKYGFPSAASYIKGYMLMSFSDMGTYFEILENGSELVYSKKLLPELVSKSEPEIRSIVEDWYNNEKTFDEIVTEITGKSTIEEYMSVLNQIIGEGFEELNLFNREQTLIYIAGQAYAKSHPIIITKPDGTTSNITNWFGSTVRTMSYTVTEAGNYTFKVTGPSGYTEEITYTLTKLMLDKKEIINDILNGNTVTETLTAQLENNFNESDLKWTTSDSNVAEIQGEGTTVNVVLKSAGEATITATCGVYTATCKIKVNEVKIQLDKEEMTTYIIGEGNTEQQTITATLTNLNEKDLKWSTSDKSIAEIQGEGKTVNIILKKGGEVTITATCGKYSISCKITVEVVNWDLSKVDVVKSADNQNVPVPKGYVASTIEGEKSVADGFVIKKGTNGVATSGVNEFVWVPVSDESFNEMFATSEIGPIYLSGQSGETGVKTEYYSKLRIRTGDSYTSVKPGVTSGIREPDLANGNNSYAVQAGYTNLAAMAQGFVDDYKNMRASIQKYKGFYIGRYELTGTVDTPTVQLDVVLSEYSAGSWYSLYKACRNVAKEGSVTSTMIWGCQWDETMNWLKNTKFKGNESAVDSDSRTWGNYVNSYGNAAVKKEDGKNAYGSPQITGYSKKYWSANNICDLAGNYFEFTQEAGGTYDRIFRGGVYNDTGWNNPASVRNGKTRPQPQCRFYACHTLCKSVTLVTDSKRV